MYSLKSWTLFAFSLLCFSFCKAEANDSLQQVLASAKEDTSRMVAYSQLALIPGQDIHLALSYLDSALVIGERVTDKNYVGRIIKNKGEIFSMRSQPDSAAYYFRQAIDVFTLTSNWQELTMTHYSLGNVYTLLEQTDLALESYITGAKLAGQHNVSRGKAYNTNGIATIHFKLKDYGQAKRYHSEALDISKEVGDPKLTAWIYTGLANTLLNTGEVDSALTYFSNALESYTEGNYLPGIAGAHNNIGVCYSYLEKYDQAIEHYHTAAFTKHKYGELNGEVTALMNISQLFILMEQRDSAIYYARAAVLLAEDLPSLSHKTKAFGITAEAYAYNQQFDSAFKYEKLFKEYTDSLYDKNLNEQITDMQAKYESDQQQQQIALLEKNNQIGTLYNYFFAAAGFIVLVIGLFVYGRYRSKKKANIRLEEQNAQISQQKKEITDSILYAKRIQQALLASESLVRNNVKDFFIFYKPKDIVSGDFYWAANKDHSFWMAVCDSTGHGVPGAFMSLLNTTFLNEAINEKGILQPGEVFNFARKKLIENLSQTDDGEAASSDGMDGTLLKISGNTISYCGANGTAVRVRKGEVLELQTDKMPVGRSPREVSAFTTHELSVQPGDAVYVFTDGYSDQFGGEKGKKFKYKNLLQLLAVNSTRPAAEQKEVLEKSLNKWKGGLEQVDDVLVIGLFF